MLSATNIKTEDDPASSKHQERGLSSQQQASRQGLILSAASLKTKTDPVSSNHKDRG
jgi:hypothetical protein